MEGWTDRQVMDRQTDGRMDKETDRWRTDGQTDGRMNGQIEGWADRDRQTDGRMDGRTDRLKDKSKTERQMGIKECVKELKLAIGQEPTLGWSTRKMFH